MKSGFLCGACRRVMCRECKGIADEYDELLRNQKAYLHKANQQLEQAQAETERQRKRADEYERLMKLGQHPLMLAWIDSMTPTQLRQAVERAAPAREGEK